MLVAIWAPPVRIVPIAKDLTPRRKSLPIEAAVQYGLLEPKTHTATELTVGLLATRTDKELYDAFARHILLSLGGLRVVETAQQMELDGKKVTSDSLAECLTDQGFQVTIHNTAINSLRMWLAKAGIFPLGRRNTWKVDSLSKSRLLGMSDSTIAQLAWLKDDQKAYLEALCRIDPPGWHPASSIRDLADRILGRRLDRSNLPKTYLEPLQNAGLIQYRSGGTASGKTSLLLTTTMFKKDILQRCLFGASGEHGQNLAGVTVDHHSHIAVAFPDRRFIDQKHPASLSTAPRSDQMRPVDYQAHDQMPTDPVAAGHRPDGHRLSVLDQAASYTAKNSEWVSMNRPGFSGGFLS